MSHVLGGKMQCPDGFGRSLERKVDKFCMKERNERNP
jgi:hypothetical protein